MFDGNTWGSYDRCIWWYILKKNVAPINNKYSAADIWEICK